MTFATDSAGGNPRRYSLPLSDAASSVDPTGTSELRQRFRRAMDARWHRLRNLTSDAIAKSDILGIGGVSINSIQYAPLRGAGRVDAFQRWFAEGTRQAVTDGDGAWTAPYIAQAYAMGARRALKLVGEPMRTGDDRSNMLAALTISELHGVAGTTAQQATRAVAYGLGARQRPEKIARMVADRINSVGRARSRTVVDYMVVKAFNAAILDTLRAAGVTWVHTIPEHLRGAGHFTDAARKTPQQRHSGSGQFRARGQFERKIPQKRHKKTGQFVPFKPKPSGYLIKQAKKEYRQHRALGEDVDVITAGDDRVCDVCDDIAANGPYAIDTAEGLIPAHPSCRCSFAPASAVEAVGDAGPPDEPRDPAGKWTAGGAEGEKTAESTQPTMEGRGDEVLINARAVAEKQGFNPEKISVSDEVRTFTLNGVEYKYAGVAHLDKGTITLYPKTIHPGTTVGIAAHEIMHQKFDTVRKAFQAEHDEVMKLEPPEGKDYWSTVMKPDGTLREPYDKQFPIYAKWNEVYSSKPSTLFSESDGVSSYSYEYWKGWKGRTVNTELAFHETLSEMARLKLETDKFPEHMGHRIISYRAGEGTSAAGRVAKAAKVWRDLYRAVNKLYPLALKKLKQQ